MCGYRHPFCREHNPQCPSKQHVDQRATAQWLATLLCGPKKVRDGLREPEVLCYCERGSCRIGLDGDRGCHERHRSLERVARGATTQLTSSVTLRMVSSLRSSTPFRHASHCDRVNNCRCGHSRAICCSTRFTVCSSGKQAMVRP